MAWIEVHQSLRDHRKILAVAGELDMPEVHVAGHMVYLWLWSLDNAQDGKLPQAERIIERAAAWEGTPGALITAMLNAAMIERGEDGRICIHDWHEYAGRLIEKRKSDAERKRLSRTCTDRPTDITRTTDGQPTDVAGTVPNRTLPNHLPNGKVILNGQKGHAPTLTIVGSASADADVDHESASALAKTVVSKVVYGRDSPAFLLAVRLAEAIRRTKPDAKIPANLQKWCSPMDLAIRVDKRPYERLCAVVDWLPSSEFWRRNILSAGTFREKLDRLELEMDADAKRGGNGNGRSGPSDRANGRPTTAPRQLPTEADIIASIGGNVTRG